VAGVVVQISPSAIYGIADGLTSLELSDNVVYHRAVRESPYPQHSTPAAERHSSLERLVESNRRHGIDKYRTWQKIIGRAARQ